MPVARLARAPRGVLEEEYVCGEEEREEEERERGEGKHSRLHEEKEQKLFMQ